MNQQPLDYCIISLPTELSSTMLAISIFVRGASQKPNLLLTVKKPGITPKLTMQPGKRQPSSSPAQVNFSLFQPDIF